MPNEQRDNKKIVLEAFPTAKSLEVGDALHKGGGYGFYILARRKAIGRKGRTESEAWRNAARVCIKANVSPTVLEMAERNRHA